MSLLKKLEDQLNCCICLDTYTNPKLLQCNHVNCQKCLVKLVARDQQHHLVLACPSCRYVTSVPDSGVAGLQTAFRVIQLLEIVEEQKKTALATAHAVTPDTASTEPAPHESITLGCSEHEGRELALYCETCEKNICWRCIKQEEKHHSHDYQELDEAFERYKGEISNLLEPIEKYIVTIEKALAQFDSRHDEISDQRGNIEADINGRFALLHQALDTRKTELFSQLHLLTEAKLKNLAVRRDLLETTQAQLSGYLLLMKENLETGNKKEALQMKSISLRQATELTTTFKQEILEPNTDADMVFSVLADLSSECQNYGKIYAPGPPDPSICCAVGEGVATAVVGEKASADLRLFDYTGLATTETPTASISCGLTSDITGTKTRGGVEKKGQKQYEISYQPSTKGKHQLHITVEAQNIMGSPFTVFVKSPVEKLCVPIAVFSGLKGPRGVAVTEKGEVVVTESSRNCITVFNSGGEKLRSFGRSRGRPGHLNHPRGVAVDVEGNILVCDNRNDRIQKFTAQGEFLAAVGSGYGGSVKLMYPRGIAVNTSSGRVYVTGYHGVKILNSDLSYYGDFGKKGRSSAPWGIACDSDGTVYVVDKDHHCIQVFTAEGEFLMKICAAELSHPHSLGIDSSGNLYVSEVGRHCVSVFTPEGKIVTAFGSVGKELGQFKCPYGVAVDSSGVVYVCDSDNNNVQLF